MEQRVNIENKNKKRDPSRDDEMKKKIEEEVEKTAEAMLRRIFSTFNMNTLELMLTGLFKFFKTSYKKIIVNDNQI